MVTLMATTDTTETTTTNDNPSTPEVSATLALMTIGLDAILNRGDHATGTLALMLADTAKP